MPPPFLFPPGFFSETPSQGVGGGGRFSADRVFFEFFSRYSLSPTLSRGARSDSVESPRASPPFFRPLLSRSVLQGHRVNKPPHRTPGPYCVQTKFRRTGASRVTVSPIVFFLTAFFIPPPAVCPLTAALFSFPPFPQSPSP